MTTESLPNHLRTLPGIRNKPARGVMYQLPNNINYPFYNEFLEADKTINTPMKTKHYDQEFIEFLKVEYNLSDSEINQLETEFAEEYGEYWTQKPFADSESKPSLFQRLKQKIARIFTGRTTIALSNFEFYKLKNSLRINHPNIDELKTHEVLEIVKQNKKIARKRKLIMKSIIVFGALVFVPLIIALKQRPNR